MSNTERCSVVIRSFFGPGEAWHFMLTENVEVSPKLYEDLQNKRLTHGRRVLAAVLGGEGALVC